MARVPLCMPGGIAPGTVSTVDFAGSAPESFTDFMNAYGPGTESIPVIGVASILSTGDGQTITNAPVGGGVIGSAEYIWSFGNDDTITDEFGTAEIYAYGSANTVTGGIVWAGGHFRLITLLGAGSATLSGANDTVSASADGDQFTVQGQRHHRHFRWREQHGQ